MEEVSWYVDPKWWGCVFGLFSLLWAIYLYNKLHKLQGTVALLQIEKQKREESFKPVKLNAMWLGDATQDLDIVISNHAPTQLLGTYTYKTVMGVLPDNRPAWKTNSVNIDVAPRTVYKQKHKMQYPSPVIGYTLYRYDLDGETETTIPYTEKHLVHGLPEENEDPRTLYYRPLDPRYKKAYEAD